MEQVCELLQVVHLKPWQEQAIEKQLSGSHVFLTQPTGAGKSLAFQIPALMSNGLTIVIEPLVALMKEQVSRLISKGIAANYLLGNISVDREVENANILANLDQLKMLYLSPEKFALSNEVTNYFS